MKNSFGNHLQITLFGESHGPFIGAVLDGLAPGIFVDEYYIKKQLLLRKPCGSISTGRHEDDDFSIVSGIYRGRTTGSPLCILIPNRAQNSADYENERVIRPGHADYTAYCKYHGFEDFRGGGHFSGRITAALTAAGAVANLALVNKGIQIGSHLLSVMEIKDRGFDDFEKDIRYLNKSIFAVLDEESSAAMIKKIEEAAAEGDSAGGILETAIIGLPPGLGEPWFDTVEGMLAHAIFSIPGVKGVDFGLGFEGSTSYGSEYNDDIVNSGGQIITETNNNGGINGGITNGMPVVFRTAVKPTPSISKEQRSIDPETKENISISVRGRHDPAIIHRARVVVDSMTAIVIYDMLSGRFGTDYFAG